MVDAFQWGFNFVEEEDDENVKLARFRLVLALILADPQSSDTLRALEDLGVTSGRDQYVFRPPMHSVPDSHDPYSIWVTPRSMMDVLSLAA